MAFSGGFETMKAGKDTTCLLDMVFVHYMSNFNLGSRLNHKQLNKGATVVGGQCSLASQSLSN